MIKTLTIPETAARLGLEFSTVCAYRSKSSPYLDASNDGVTLASVVAYEKRSVDLSLARISNLAEIQAILEADDGLTNAERGYRPRSGKPLPPEGPSDIERDMLCLRSLGATYLTIGDNFGKSKERVRQIVSGAVERLYKPEQRVEPNLKDLTTCRKTPTMRSKTLDRF